MVKLKAVFYRFLRLNGKKKENPSDSFYGFFLLDLHEMSAIQKALVHRPLLKTPSNLVISSGHFSAFFSMVTCTLWLIAHVKKDKHFNNQKPEKRLFCAACTFISGVVESASATRFGC